MKPLALAACAVVLALASGACTNDPEGLNRRRRATTAVPEDDELPGSEGEPGELAPTQHRAAEATFSPGGHGFPNPERGFYQQHNLLTVTDTGLTATANDGLRLILGLVRLDDDRGGPLSQATLQALARGFALVRQHGLKVILRFAYNSPVDYAFETAPDATLALVQQHLGELKPILHDNADVIAFWQAGFIGAWGEWHSSENQLDSAENKAAVRDALLNALPADRTLQIRYAWDAIRWFPQALDRNELPASSAPARIGLHDDCFLSSHNDVGTYDADPSTAERQRAYVRAMSAVTPFGGETCNPTDMHAGQMRSRCADVIGEGRDYHLTYLNRDYYAPGFQDKWKLEGCYETVAGSMGYRFQLVSAAHDPFVARGGALELRFVVRNTGWARLTNPRPLHVLLRHRTRGSLVDQIVTEIDPRRWLPGGADQPVQVLLPIPLTAAAGDYDVFLALPDAAPRLSADPRYAIRWANADNPGLAQSWDPSAGRFRLGTTVELR